MRNIKIEDILVKTYVRVWVARTISMSLIMHQSFETPASPPSGIERGIHFFCKWRQVKSPVPGRKVNGELPRPHMIHTHAIKK